ncbi:poly(hydroxyalkanoate) depolymerase family esterase [Allocatelliglobosispora scoriae]|uniref:Poly(Hydroxyalkanoate) depolymerase family esterase n=1 Tax=Allocatelliglobosispora scoriae TaxID=643052 RepID=A0A841BZ08_9ACTN|nr:PHB depolymerase family esterase [Allocatelliglobosispora scoriae]MBB5872816.1 poly(hydroxyalkanoate) depolymerase family esterase [Allocatelliglobosispora scoriae]
MKRTTTSLLSAAIVAFVAAAAVAMTSQPAAAATLTEVTGFGNNPTNLRMHLYVPNNVAARPPILVAVHYCTGSGPAFYSGTQFASLADQYGFIVIYPSATRSGSCFDVSSPQALTHNGGSDPVGIVSMVNYVLQRNNADPSRVYVTGASSGGMMTNVLLGAYPDVFKAGASFMGVPFGCFATTDGSMWNSTCANGQLIKTAQQWGDQVRAAYPGYTGARPRVQLWHGTNDQTLRYPNFGEAIKQWTNVHGLSQTPSSTDTPQSGWTRTRYGSTGGTAQVEAISLNGVGHDLPQSGQAALAIAFLGLNGTTPPSPSVSPSASRPPSPSASPSASPSVSASPSPSSSPQPSGPCRIGYVLNPWNTGLTAEITITNTGTTAISGWSLVFTLAGGQVITSGWNATYAPTSGQVTARNVSYNGSIAPGASTGIGFQATHTGNTTRPATFTLNGATCAIA